MRDRSSNLRELVELASRELNDADAVSILKWADQRLDGRLVVATSMQDAVVIDLATQVHPGIDVIFLETGYHFAETLGMRDAVAATYDIRLLSVQPALTVSEQDAAYGPRLHDRNPDLCCHLRKVVPLDAMLGMYDGWVTGLRRADSTSRIGVTPIEWDPKREMIKVNPIVNWKDDEVAAYTRERGVLVNPLLAEGYPSIGCQPCTARVRPGEDPRSGRWVGQDKSECGLHSPAPK